MTCQLCQHSVRFTSSNYTHKDKEKNDAGGKRSFDVEVETDTAGLDFIYQYYYHYSAEMFFLLYYILKL